MPTIKIRIKDSEGKDQDIDVEAVERGIQVYSEAEAKMVSKRQMLNEHGFQIALLDA